MNMKMVVRVAAEGGEAQGGVASTPHPNVIRQNNRFPGKIRGKDTNRDVTSNEIPNDGSRDNYGYIIDVISPQKRVGNVGSAAPTGTWRTLSLTVTLSVIFTLGVIFDLERDL
jgi:hypothetical protein